VTDKINADLPVRTTAKEFVHTSTLRNLKNLAVSVYYEILQTWCDPWTRYQNLQGFIRDLH